MSVSDDPPCALADHGDLELLRKSKFGICFAKRANDIRPGGKCNTVLVDVRQKPRIQRDFCSLPMMPVKTVIINLRWYHPMAEQGLAHDCATITPNNIARMSMSLSV